MRLHSVRYIRGGLYAGAAGWLWACGEPGPGIHPANANAKESRYCRYAGDMPQ